MGSAGAYRCRVSLPPSEDLPGIGSAMKRCTGCLFYKKLDDKIKGQFSFFLFLLLIKYWTIPLYTSFHLITATALWNRYSISSILWMREPRFREVKCLVQGHTARKCWSWGSNPGLFDLWDQVTLLRIRKWSFLIKESSLWPLFWLLGYFS